MTVSADQMTGVVEQVRKCLDTLDLTVDKLDNPAERLLLHEQYQLMHNILSAALAELHREVQKLPALHLGLRTDLASRFFSNSKRAGA
jgi:hypothetical protein